VSEFTYSTAWYYVNFDKRMQMLTHTCTFSHTYIAQVCVSEYLHVFDCVVLYVHFHTRMHIFTHVCTFSHTHVAQVCVGCQNVLTYSTAWYYMYIFTHVCTFSHTYVAPVCVECEM